MLVIRHTNKIFNYIVLERKPQNFGKTLSLRGAERRSNLLELQRVRRLLCSARNDSKFEQLRFSFRHYLSNQEEKKIENSWN